VTQNAKKSPVVLPPGRQILPLLVGWCLVLLAQTGGASPVDHIPLAEIKPGMVGYGLTVFEGSAVDTFGVTVIGVQEKCGRRAVCC